MTTASDDLRSADGELRSGHHLLAGVLTLIAGIVLLAGVLFGLTAGIGAIWTSVTSNGASVSGTAPGGAAAPGPAANAAGAAATPAAPTVERVRVRVNPPPLGGVKTAGGDVHDAFVPANFTVKVGDVLQITVLNYDDAPHTWTSPGLGLNIRIPGGSESHPSQTTFTIHPTQAGTFEWYCATPCDPWSMTRNGYMRGRVTVA